MMSFPRYQHRHHSASGLRLRPPDLEEESELSEHSEPSWPATDNGRRAASSTLAVPEPARVRSHSFSSPSHRPEANEDMRSGRSPPHRTRQSLAPTMPAHDYVRRHSSARLEQRYQHEPYSPTGFYSGDERDEPRRRLPPTPGEINGRRSSSPRQAHHLPRSLPPPSPTELIPEVQNLNRGERRGSGRRLPQPPPIINTEHVPSYQITPTIDQQYQVTLPTLPQPPMPASPPLVLPKVRTGLCNGYNSSQQQIPNTTIVRERVDTGDSMENQQHWQGVGQSFDHYDQSFETPSTNPESQLSSLSPSIEQLTSKSSSDAEDPIALGLNPDLYRQNSVSSSSVPDFTGAVSVTGSSSWPDSSEPRPTGLGLVHFTTHYFPVRKRLRVSLLKAEGLAGQLRPELELHAFVKVCLMPGKLQKQRSRIVRRTRDAAFNEEFFFDNVATEEIRTKSLNLRICHHTGKQFQKDVVIGEIDVPLKNVPDLLSKKEIRLLEELKPKINVKRLGRLQVSSCLELDARRLTITVIKADDLPKYGISGPPDPMVKITLDQKTGRIQTKQSRVLKNTCSAVYKEGISFLVSTRQQDLHSTKITMAVIDTSRTASGNDIIGQACLGLTAIDRSELEQWRNTVENPGKEFKTTHALKLPKDDLPQVHVDEAQDVESDEEG